MYMFTESMRTHGNVCVSGLVKLSDARPYGSGLSWEVWGSYAVGQMPSNYVLARVGAPRWLSLLILCWGLVTTLTAAMKTRTHFYLLRFFLGKH